MSFILFPNGDLIRCTAIESIETRALPTTRVELAIRVASGRLFSVQCETQEIADEHVQSLLKAIREAEQS